MQTPDPGSDWCKPEDQNGAGWTEETTKVWLHRLGNLCVLNTTHNSAARNKSFSIKKEVLFGEPMVKGLAPGLTAFSLSQVPVWNPAAVKSRQADLLNCLAVRWEFKQGWASMQSDPSTTVAEGQNAHSCPR